MANIFAWTCDSFGSWSVQSASRVSIDTTEKIQGTGSMKVVIPGNIQGAHGPNVGDRAIGSGVNGGWLYYRWWMKIHSAFTWGNADKKMKSGRVNRASFT